MHTYSKKNMLYQKVIKSILDFLLALILLVILLPIIILTFLILSMVNKGKVFFVQKRPGLHGEIFELLKFKTMTDDKDSEGNLLPDHQRQTAFGQLIRKLSLDELPQLVNVLKGDMSLVGPRPLLPKYLPLYNDFQKHRHDVKPVITGWAQVNGRNAISWNQKFDLDIYYVRNISFVLDLKILFLTLKKVIIREGVNSSDVITMEEFKGN